MLGWRSLAAAAAVASAASTAPAQVFLRDVNALGMGKPEWSMMAAAGESLYAHGDPVAGAEARWTAPSGVSGVVTAEEVGPRADGALCVRLRYEVSFPRPSATETARARRCRIDGAWLLSAE